MFFSRPYLLPLKKLLFYNLFKMEVVYLWLPTMQVPTVITMEMTPL